MYNHEYLAGVVWRLTADKRGSTFQRQERNEKATDPWVELISSTPRWQYCWQWQCWQL